VAAEARGTRQIPQPAATNSVAHLILARRSANGPTLTLGLLAEVVRRSSSPMRMVAGVTLTAKVSVTHAWQQQRSRTRIAKSSTPRRATKRSLVPPTCCALVRRVELPIRAPNKGQVPRHKLLAIATTTTDSVMRGQAWANVKRTQLICMTNASLLATFVHRVGQQIRGPRHSHQVDAETTTFNVRPGRELASAQ